MRIPESRVILARHPIPGEIIDEQENVCSPWRLSLRTCCRFIQAQAPAATLTIHTDQPLHAVSPTLYGLMTEEINFSYDGGLYAEMVRNRTFGNDWSGILHWYLVENGNAAAKERFRRHDDGTERGAEVQPAR